MDSTGEPLRSLIERFDPELQVAKALAPPGSWYTDPGIFELERRAVFRQTWQPVAPVAQLAQPGCFVAGDLLGEPYVLLRDSSGELRAFFNVCRHHGARVASGEGRCDRLVCPYHGWSYDLDGRLRKAPRVGGIEDFDPEDFGLRPIAVRTWGPLILVCLADEPPDLDRWVAELTAELSETRWDRLAHVERRIYALECNWKVFVDNYLDGGYHLETGHPSLAAELEPTTYRTDVFGRSSLQSVSAPEQALRVRGGARYAWLYPALMLNRYGPVLDVNRVVPVGPERCQVIFDFYFEDPTDEDFVARSLEASDRIQREDAELCESVQAGLRSVAYDRGRYAPRVEQAMHAFHCQLARDLRRALP